MLKTTTTIYLFNVSFLNTLPNKPPGCFKTKHSDQLIFIGHESIVNSDCLCEWECLAISFAVTWLRSLSWSGGAVPQSACHVDSAAAGGATQTIRTHWEGSREAGGRRCCTDNCVPLLKQTSSSPPARSCHCSDIHLITALLFTAEESCASVWGEFGNILWAADALSVFGVFLIIYAQSLWYNRVHTLKRFKILKQI